MQGLAISLLEIYPYPSHCYPSQWPQINLPRPPPLIPPPSIQEPPNQGPMACAPRTEEDATIQLLGMALRAGMVGALEASPCSPTR